MTLANIALNIAVPILPPAERVCATQIFIVQGKIESASRPSLMIGDVHVYMLISD